MINTDSALILVIVVAVLCIAGIIAFFLIREKSLKDSYESKQISWEESQRKNNEWEQEILISQIQPHFIYNVLNTIKYLCKKDANEAAEAIDRFSDFLRGSMNAFSIPDCIPFLDEIKIVDNYIFLEKKRFGDKIEVIYDFKVTDFKVPALSIQPLVENAIKHGVTKKVGGGCVWIKTNESDDGYFVEIIDNGAGFYLDEIKNDGKVHVGIENTKNRLLIMCQGALVIESEKNVTTKAVIFIPKEK